MIWGHSAGKWRSLYLKPASVTRAHVLTYCTLLPLLKAVWGNTCYAMNWSEDTFPSLLPFQLPGLQARAPAKALVSLTHPILPASRLHSSPPSFSHTSRRLPGHLLVYFLTTCKLLSNATVYKTSSNHSVSIYYVPRAELGPLYSHPASPYEFWGTEILICIIQMGQSKLILISDLLRVIEQVRGRGRIWTQDCLGPNGLGV